jgi:hypothetical protein
MEAAMQRTEMLSHRLLQPMEMVERRWEQLKERRLLQSQALKRREHKSRPHQQQKGQELRLEVGEGGN